MKDNYKEKFHDILEISCNVTCSIGFSPVLVGYCYSLMQYLNLVHQSLK
jgi:hypothetical protein